MILKSVFPIFCRCSCSILKTVSLIFLKVYFSDSGAYISGILFPKKMLYHIISGELVAIRIVNTFRSCVSIRRFACSRQTDSSNNSKSICQLQKFCQQLQIYFATLIITKLHGSTHWGKYFFNKVTI